MTAGRLTASSSSCRACEFIRALLARALFVLPFRDCRASVVVTCLFSLAGRSRTRTAYQLKCLLLSRRVESELEPTVL